jgi:hypothetical protein
LLLVFSWHRSAQIGKRDKKRIVKGEGSPPQLVGGPDEPKLHTKRPIRNALDDGAAVAGTG